MSFYRTHLCSELTIKNLNQEVILSGWIDTIRDHGNLIFIDLRDNYGKTQCVVDAKKEIFENVSKLVKNGIYKYTRNPMYLGMLLIILSTVIYYLNLFSVFTPIIFVLWINKFHQLLIVF